MVRMSQLLPKPTVEKQPLVRAYPLLHSSVLLSIEVVASGDQTMLPETADAVVIEVCEEVSAKRLVATAPVVLLPVRVTRPLRVYVLEVPAATVASALVLVKVTVTLLLASGPVTVPTLPFGPV